MKTVIPSENGHPTIESLYRLFHASDTLPIVRQQAAELIAKIGALPNDPINRESAGVIPDDPQERASAPASVSTSPAEDINPGFQGTSGRTPSRQPQKVRREDDWAPTITRGTPMAMSDVPAARGREPRRIDERVLSPRSLRVSCVQEHNPSA